MAAAGDLPEHVRLNRAVWDQWALQYAEPGERAWAAAEPTWGIWDVPESELQRLPAAREWARQWPSEEVWKVRLRG